MFAHRVPERFCWKVVEDLLLVTKCISGTKCGQRGFGPASKTASWKGSKTLCCRGLGHCKAPRPLRSGKAVASSPTTWQHDSMIDWFWCTGVLRLPLREYKSVQVSWIWSCDQVVWIFCYQWLLSWRMIDLPGCLQLRWAIESMTLRTIHRPGWTWNTFVLSRKCFKGSTWIHNSIRCFQTCFYILYQPRRKPNWPLTSPGSGSEACGRVEDTESTKAITWQRCFSHVSGGLFQEVWLPAVQQIHEVSQRIKLDMPGISFISCSWLGGFFFPRWGWLRLQKLISPAQVCAVGSWGIILKLLLCSKWYFYYQMELQVPGPRCTGI